MNPTLSPRTIEVWKRLTGLYGGEALDRKFGLTPPDEWVAMLGRLGDYEIDRALRRLAYGAKGTVPSLPEFVSLARMARHDDWDEPQLGPPRLEHQYAGDVWDMRANSWLLHYLTSRQREGWLYCDLDCNPNSQESKDLTAPLVKYKNAWARDMREYGKDVPLDYQVKHWRADMALAEIEITKVRERYLKQAAA
jgi:hypothetical protein